MFILASASKSVEVKIAQKRQSNSSASRGFFIGAYSADSPSAVDCHSEAEPKNLIFLAIKEILHSAALRSE